MTIDLFICGYKGLQVVKHLCASGFSKNIQTVFAAKDSNVINDYFIDIENTCKEHGLKLIEKQNDNYAGTADYRFVIGWRWMIDRIENTIVLHDSLLPEYRGFAPLVNALIHGESVIGATAIMATDKYDTGPIIASKKITIEHPVRIQQAVEEISKLYVQLIDGIMQQIAIGNTLETIPQDERKASYSLWRDENDYLLNWNDDSEKILRTIYALSYPYSGAQTLLNGERVIIEDAETLEDVKIINRDPGKVIFVLAGYPVVVCGKGLLKITSASGTGSGSILPLKKLRSRFGR